MKGPNGIRACRRCKICGVRDVDGGGKTHYYLPLHRDPGPSLDSSELPLRTHDEFIDEAVAADAAATNAEAERLSKATGINGLPVLATLSSLSFPESFCHDLMHLLPENVISNLLDFWTGSYKKLDEGDEEFEFAEGVLEEIGRNCAAAGIRHLRLSAPASRTSTPNGTTLRRSRTRPGRRCSRPFSYMIASANDCLRLSIDRDHVDGPFRAGVYKWVEDYERYYYQYDPSRFSACPLTIHALLHIPDDIFEGGPMWTYWNYVTERYVGYLVRSSKSRKNPYASFARRLREIAQNSMIKVKYHLARELNLSPRREEEISGRQVPSYTGIRVLHPRADGPLARSTRTAVNTYLRNTYRISRDNAASAIPEAVIHWGKISFLDGGDKIRGWEMFIKARRTRTTLTSARTTRVSLGSMNAKFGVDHPLLLAVVRPVRLHSKNKRLDFPYYKDGKFLPIEVIDVDDISCLVARIPGHGKGPRKYALCERPDAMLVGDDVSDNE
ncbi:hypothetical protein MKEN_00575700 [Mycena kentingensis (nom. inval.)]|nr:hypothetical protein MKEN_00575700 [Mycena kentingensis (nom. inval.)]